MRRILSLLTLTPCALFASAPPPPADADAPAGAQIVPLWANVSAPASLENPPAERRDGAAHASRISAPRLWVFLPEKPKGETGSPMVLVVPGGGYGTVGHGYEGVEVARELNRRGIAAAVLLYRCDPHRYPAPLLDARRAMELLQANAKSWRVDTRKIGVMGFSAGGHLAGLTTSLVIPSDAQPAAVRPAFCVLVYPVVRLRGPLAHAGSGVNLLGRDRVGADADALALDLLADKSWPRTYILHEVRDSAVPVKGAETLAARLRELGAPVELRLTPGADHGFGWNRPDATGKIRGPAGWLPEVCDWVSR